LLEIFKQLAGLMLLESLLSQETINGIIDNENKGFVLWSYVIDEAEILSFGVLPQFQRQGLGSLLLEEMIHILTLKKALRIFLEVSLLNKAALDLYLKKKFSIIGKRKNYYIQKGIPIDALILERQLNS
jgi:[ribosomal protein S18]-alanine N-acetyltransferase